MQFKAGGHKQNTLKHAWPISNQLQNQCLPCYPSCNFHLSTGKKKNNNSGCCLLLIHHPKLRQHTPNDGLSGIKYTIHLHDPWINIVSNGIPMFNSLSDFGSAAVFCPPLVQAGEGPAENMWETGHKPTMTGDGWERIHKVAGFGGWLMKLDWPHWGALKSCNMFNEHTRATHCTENVEQCWTYWGW